MGIKEIIKASPFAPIAIKLYAPLYDWKWRERKINTGGKLNPQKTFFVCRRVSRYTGLLSDAILMLGHIDYARKKGYIPVVDMMTYPNVQLYDDEVGKINAWEYYFKQPADNDGKRYSLEEVFSSQNVILSDGCYCHDMPKDTTEFLKEDSLIDYWSNVWKQNIEYSDKLQGYLCSQLNDLPQNLVGVHARGTGYRKFTKLGSKSGGNHVQPTVEYVLDQSICMMVENNCDGILLATEDMEYYQRFKEVLGERLYTVDTQFIDATNIDLQFNLDTAYTTDRINDKMLRGFEYLAAMVAFSKCRIRISGINSGTIIASIMEPNVENSYYYDLGRAH
ncbi:MAG: hypothetical protein K6F52_06430 [Clostridia bacterium]|nr:hypothetical protein [Clostridia bacterium]